MEYKVTQSKQSSNLSKGAVRYINGMIAWLRRLHPSSSLLRGIARQQFI